MSDGKHIDSINLAINEDDLKNEQIINYLIANGANVNIQDRGNQTPLHNAATRGNLVAIHALLTVSNINVNVKFTSSISAPKTQIFYCRLLM